MKKLLLSIVALSSLVVLSTACGKKGGSSSSHQPKETEQNASFFTAAPHTFAYHPETIFEESLQKCIYGIQAETSCTVSELPLIGLTTKTITVDDILERTMVSHAFLGDSFRDVLKALDPSILRMFSGISAVVISDKINPSFYNYDSATIYLSARYFWRTPKERDITNKKSDPRSGYAEAIFSFHFDWDYVIDRQYFSLAPTSTRTLDQIKPRVSRLLFHELTHASDAYPPAIVNTGKVPLSKTYYQIFDDRIASEGGRVSDGLPTAPRSELLKQMEKILQTGKDPDKLADTLTAEMVIDEIGRDVVTDNYAYYNPREDAAMLMEEALMFHYYGAVRVHALIDWDADEDEVTMARSGSIFSAPIAARAFYLLDNLLDAKFKDQFAGAIQGRQMKVFPKGSTWKEIQASEL